MTLNKQAIKVTTFLAKLNKYYPNEICHLTWNKDQSWTLLFAVILSAQCTDKQVNLVTEKLFAKFPQLEDYWQKPLNELEDIIRSIGLFRSKAKYLRNSAEKIYFEFQGQLPSEMDKLTSLPGVGRKTANVILWNVFEKNEGMVVDTHIGRISQRVGFTENNDPEKIEQDLMLIFPRKSWGRVSHQLIQFGRDYCQAKKPNCESCIFTKVCPKQVYR